MKKSYSSKSNANRARANLAAKLADDFTFDPVASGDGKSWFFTVRSARHEVQLTPDERALLEPFVVIFPAAPTPEDAPAPRNKMKPYAEWDSSMCDTPVAVAWEVYGYYLAAGRIDERKSAIETAMAAGVQRNTAHTQYRRFRIKHGLPGAVGSTK